MQLNELISLPIYENAKVIAGVSGMSNIVQSLTIMDAPDIIHFLKPHELLLTTGYAMKDQPDALLSLVTSMATGGCSGLAIKTKRFFDELPSLVIEQANTLNFPIIELSLEHSLGDISNQSLSYILEKRTDELNYALTTHKQFSYMIMQGKTTMHIIEELEQLTKSPILLVNPRFVHIHASSAFPHHHMQQWLLAIQLEMESSSDMMTELTIAAPHATERSEIVWLEILPIFTYQLEGYLIAATKQLSSQLRNLTKHALEQATNVIGLELMKRQAVKERSRRYKNEFFSNFVDGVLSSEQELLHRCSYYELTEHSIYWCGIVKEDHPSEMSLARPTLSTDGHSISERDRHYYALKAELANLKLPYVVFTKNDYFCFIIAPQGQSNSELVMSKQHNLLTQLQQVVDSVHQQYNISISIGVGDPVTKLLDIPLSYKEALQAVQLGIAEHKKQFVQAYKAKNLNYLLRMLPKEELKEYYEETFGELLHIEHAERVELLKTLRIFYDTHCWLAETAKQLFVHRNTVSYRLDKCEKLTGRKLRDSSESLRFRTAFAMESLLTEA